ncbi:hypothetical protein BASA83_000219 [Batrachochytrium salamandrivorans]|nr:hypothetical protein BASA62_009612 [Batrachochytrium salamandrivorans]KAH9277352.1 hypothetical protein BASA83_000219 [Batrachochytrium salamandrivorans]
MLQDGRQTDDGARALVFMQSLGESLSAATRLLSRTSQRGSAVGAAHLQPSVNAASSRHSHMAAEQTGPAGLQAGIQAGIQTGLQTGLFQEQKPDIHAGTKLQYFTPTVSPRHAEQSAMAQSRQTTPGDLLQTSLMRLRQQMHTSTMEPVVVDVVDSVDSADSVDAKAATFLDGKHKVDRHASDLKKSHIDSKSVQQQAAHYTQSVSNVRSQMKESIMASTPKYSSNAIPVTTQPEPDTLQESLHESSKELSHESVANSRIPLQTISPLLPNKKLSSQSGSLVDRESYPRSDHRHTPLHHISFQSSQKSSRQSTSPSPKPHPRPARKTRSATELLSPASSSLKSSTPLDKLAIQQAEAHMASLEVLQDRMHVIHSKILKQQQDLLASQSVGVHRQAGVQIDYMNELQEKQTQNQMLQMKRMREFYMKEVTDWVDANTEVVARIDKMELVQQQETARRARINQQGQSLPTTLSDSLGISKPREISIKKEANLFPQDSKRSQPLSSSSLQFKSEKGDGPKDTPLFKTHPSDPISSEAIPPELRVQLDALHTDFENVMEAVGDLQKAIQSQRSHTSDVPAPYLNNEESRMVDHANRTLHGLEDIKTLLNKSPLDAIMEAREKDRREIAAARSKRDIRRNNLRKEIGESTKVGVSSTNQSVRQLIQNKADTVIAPETTSTNFDYAQIRQRVSALGRKRDALFNDYHADPQQVNHFQDEIGTLEPKWPKKEQVGHKDPSRDSMLDDSRIKNMVSTKIQQALLGRKVEKHHKRPPTLPLHANTSLDPTLGKLIFGDSDATKSTAGHYKGSVPTKIGTPGYSAPVRTVSERLSGTSTKRDPRLLPTHKPTPTSIYERSEKSKSIKRTSPVAQTGSAPHLRAYTPPLLPRKKPATYQTQSPFNQEFQRPKHPPQPQPYPTFEPSHFTSMRSPPHPRTVSPSTRPYNFYNVRVSNAPVFLRRTTIRPPSLDFLDHTMKKLDDLKNSPSRRSPSPTHLSRKQTPDLQRSQPFPKWNSPNSATLPVSKAPDASFVVEKRTSTPLKPHTHQIETLDEAQQTLPIMESIGTQVTPTVIDRVERGQHKMDDPKNSTAGQTKTTGVHCSSSDVDVSVQYSTPDESTNNSWLNAVQVSRPKESRSHSKGRRVEPRDDFIVHQHAHHSMNRGVSEDHLEQRIAEWIQNEVLLRVLARPQGSTTVVSVADAPVLVVDVGVSTTPEAIVEDLVEASSKEPPAHIPEITTADIPKQLSMPIVLQEPIPFEPMSVCSIPEPLDVIVSVPKSVELDDKAIEQYADEVVLDVVDVALQSIARLVIDDAEQDARHEAKMEARRRDAEEAHRRELAAIQLLRDSMQMEREQLVKELEQIRITCESRKAEAAHADELYAEREAQQRKADMAVLERIRSENATAAVVSAAENTRQIANEARLNEEESTLKRIQEEQKALLKRLADDNELRTRLHRLEESLLKQSGESVKEKVIHATSESESASMGASTTTESEILEPTMSTDTTGSVVYPPILSQDISSSDSANLSTPVVSTVETTSLGLSVLSTNLSEGEILTGMYSEGEIVGKLSRHAIDTIIHGDKEGSRPNDLDDTSHGVIVSEAPHALHQRHQEVARDLNPLLKLAEPPRTQSSFDSESEGLFQSSSDPTTSSGKDLSPGEVSAIESSDVSSEPVSLNPQSKIMGTSPSDFKTPIPNADAAIAVSTTNSYPHSMPVGRFGASLQRFAERRMQDQPNLPKSSLGDSIHAHVDRHSQAAQPDSTPHLMFPPTGDIGLHTDLFGLAGSSMSISSIDETLDQQTTVGQIAMMDSDPIEVATLSHELLNAPNAPNQQPMTVIQKSGSDQSIHRARQRDLDIELDKITSSARELHAALDDVRLTEIQTRLPTRFAATETMSNISSPSPSSSSSSSSSSVVSFVHHRQQRRLPDPFEIINELDSSMENKIDVESILQDPNSTPTKGVDSRFSTSGPTSAVGSPEESHSHSNTHEDLSVTFERISAIETGHDETDAAGVDDDGEDYSSTSELTHRPTQAVRSKPFQSDSISE